jgi:hypothetical protein
MQCAGSNLEDGPTSIAKHNYMAIIQVNEYTKAGNPAILPPMVAKTEDPSILQPSVAKSQDEIVQLPVAQLENHQIRIQLINHNIILIEKVKDLPIRFWYMQQTVANGWSRDTLADMIKSAC